MSAAPIVCLPHAGAGAGFFWPWRRLAAELGRELVALQPPGREERIDEDWHTDVAAAVDDLFDRLAEQVELGGGQQIAVFGHSLGAVLGYELARRVEAETEVRVLRLFVSGSPAPDRMREQRATGLGDDEFLARVEQFAGFRHEAFDIPELREMLLPAVRADVLLHESYRPLPGPALRAPITCFRGREDLLVSREDAAGWSAASAAGAESVEFPGGHMYLLDDPAALLAAMAPRIRDAAGAPTA